MSTTARFTQFLENIKLTDQQKINGQNSRESVVYTLNQAYYGSSSGTANSQYVGSWGKRTRVRPPRDVDVLYTLPAEVYYRFQNRQGNRQSHILQEVRAVLANTYTNTAIRGSGPIVVIPFALYAVEIIPAFKLDTGQYYICMTDGGGHYKTAAYDAETLAISKSNAATNNNTRDLIRMMKRWQAYCAVPIKSFYIEILSTEFLAQWDHRGKAKNYYDWMVRDFLAYLKARAGWTTYAPGTNEAMPLGSAWEPKARAAYNVAVAACGYEASSSWGEAGAEWQKIFGPDIPRYT